MPPKMSSRRSAAESLLQSMGGGMTDPEAENEIAPPMEDIPLPEDGAMPPPEEGQGMDLEGALSGVESAIAGLSEDAAAEIRSHVEAIRDIASREPGMAESQNPTDIREELPGAPEGMTPPESPDSGMEKLPL